MYHFVKWPMQVKNRLVTNTRFEGTKLSIWAYLKIAPSKLLKYHEVGYVDHTLACCLVRKVIWEANHNFLWSGIA